VKSGGSGTAFPALINDRVQLAPISRPPTEQELASFRAAFGHEPTIVRVALDALVVFVHKDNPVPGMTLAQLDAVYSTTRRRGGSPIDRWSDLGVAGDLGAERIQLVGFDAGMGGYSLFRELVLQDGVYRTDIRAEPGSPSVVNAVGSYRNAMGYGSQFFQTKRTRMVPIASQGTAYVAPSAATCSDGSYPLSRYLYVVINVKPGAKVDPLVADFLAFALSKQGQEIAARAGNFALTAETVAAERRKLGL
jgi:phosphate transport system substrate-binding protein